MSPSTDTTDDSVDVELENWPASKAAMSAARTFLRNCAATRATTLLVPDKDADGLCGTMIVYRTLLALGLPADMIRAHFVSKGSNVHTESERVRMEKHEPKFVIVVDQGSRKSGPLVKGAEDGTVQTLVIDHHWSSAFPEGAKASLSPSVCRGYQLN